MADLTTLQSWLIDAEAARQKLRLGIAETEIEHGDMRTRYSVADAGALDSYIDDLKAQIAALGGTVTGERRRAIQIDLPGS